MNDGNRTYPVSELFIHHSTGPEFANSSDVEVQDWFSSIGKARGYSNGTVRSYHKHPSRNEETYAQAHFALRPYTADGNKYGWRLTELISDPWNNVAWHAGDWAHNQKSIGIETCGNYVGRELPEKALMLLADFWRGNDVALGGNTTTWAHQWVYATACPGGIVNQIEKIVDMQNNPDKWNQILFPAPVQPSVDARPEWQKNFTDKTDFIGYTKDSAPVFNLITGELVATIPRDTQVQLSGETSVGGFTYLISNYSVDKNLPNGIPSEHISTVAPETPVAAPEQPEIPIPTPEPEPAPEVSETPETPAPEITIDDKAKLAATSDFNATLISQTVGQLLTWALTFIPVLNTFDGGKWKFLQFPLGILIGAIIKRLDRFKHEDSSDSKGILPV